MDVDGDGKISKQEVKAKLKETIGLFENDMPEEHSNDYQDVYIYRNQREQVPEEDEMEYNFDGSRQPIDDGEGRPVRDVGSNTDNDEDEADDDRPDGAEYEESEEIMHEEL